jgi:hypothetical protein
MSTRSEASIHASQHKLLDQRAADLRGTKSRHARQEAGRRLYVIYDGHLRRFHGRTRITGPPQTLDELIAEHEAAHHTTASTTQETTP